MRKDMLNYDITRTRIVHRNLEMGVLKPPSWSGRNLRPLQDGGYLARQKKSLDSAPTRHEQVLSPSCISNKYWKDPNYPTVKLLIKHIYKGRSHTIRKYPKLSFKYQTILHTSTCLDIISDTLMSVRRSVSKKKWEVRDLVNHTLCGLNILEQFFLQTGSNFTWIYCKHGLLLI